MVEHFSSRKSQKLFFHHFYDFLTSDRGCQMVYCQTKNSSLDTFWRVLQWKMLMYFKDIWSILLPFDIFYDHLVYFVVIWLVFSPFWYIIQRKIWQPCVRPSANHLCPLTSDCIQFPTKFKASEGFFIATFV
jgi:hypothetical protein